jgi:hypothetical protein
VTFPTDGFQIMIIIAFCCLIAMGGFVLGVMMTNAEHRRNAAQREHQPAALPVPVVDPLAAQAAFYAAQRYYPAPAPAAPVVVTVNLSPQIPPPMWPSRGTVLNGEVVAELE